MDARSAVPAYVTSEHTAAARAAWEAARDRGAPPEQLAALWLAMEALWRRQADQFRAEFHARRRQDGRPHAV